MLTLKVSTRYPLASSGTVRAGTIGLQFSSAGTANYTTKTPGGDALDVCAPTVIAGQEIETGPLLSVGALPAGTYGIVGR